MSLHKSPLFHPWAGYAVAAIVLIADLLTKSWVSASLDLHDRVEVIPFFDITLRHNYGAAFSFLADQAGWQVWFFGILAAAVSIGLTVWIYKLPKRKVLEMLGLSLVLGGALGNLYDRVTLGYVVDFLLVYYNQYQFPAFNVADSAISVGAALLILDFFLESRRNNHSEKQAIN
ncbi:Lipoprotein signal peptidase [Thalassocella blandensis]|nr:Lipoprotein signal peptidase [Thalassocella blandensis]